MLLVLQAVLQAKGLRVHQQQQLLHAQQLALLQQALVVWTLQRQLTSPSSSSGRCCQAGALCGLRGMLLWPATAAVAWLCWMPGQSRGESRGVTGAWCSCLGACSKCSCMAECAAAACFDVWCVPNMGGSGW
jgi:hypothetical protein